jgi:hypothetical protein
LHNSAKIILRAFASTCCCVIARYNKKQDNK